MCIFVVFSKNIKLTFKWSPCWDVMISTVLGFCKSFWQWKVVLLILPLISFWFSGPQEPEEDFTLQVYGATGGAALDHAFTNVSIKILKKGHPNGLFRFTGTVFPSAIVAEPETGTATVTVPVRRDFGTTGAVNVRNILPTSLWHLFNVKAVYIFVLHRFCGVK